jgi:hypothetical protein
MFCLVLFLEHYKIRMKQVKNVRIVNSPSFGRYAVKLDAIREVGLRSGTPRKEGSYKNKDK